MCQSSRSDVRHEPRIGKNEMESSGFGLPPQASFFGVPVEKDFGKSTAVIVPVAQEKDSFHR
jgi:hypothetical protein